MSEMNCSAKWWSAREMPCAPQGSYWVYEDPWAIPMLLVLCWTEHGKVLYNNSKFCLNIEDLGYDLYDEYRVYGPVIPPEYPKEHPKN